MRPQTQKVTTPAMELLGDLHPLLEQLGSLEGLVTLQGATDSVRARAVRTTRDLREFLKSYHARILLPVELPVIQRAFFHASRNQLRELVALDGEVANEAILQNFAPASRRVGQGQLQKLRPLRDERMVQRYLAAVDAGEAQGWHTLVYGLTLAVYSLPLRQGLLGYAQQTTRGFILAAAETADATELEAQALYDELCADLPAAVEELLLKLAA